MAGMAALSSAGKSIARLVDAYFGDADPLGGPTATAKLVTTADFKESSGVPSRGVTLFPYKVDVNAPTRAAWSAVGSYDGRAHLALDLHFLLTAWADNAEDELTLIGCAMQCLETTPILSGPLLDKNGAWAPNEAVQVTLGEITTEEVMRTFDSLPTDYKLSVPYIARVLRLDSLKAVDLPTVTTAVSGITPSPAP